MKISEKLEPVPGIYCIKNIVNQKGYYGSSMQLNRRISTHIKSLRCGNGQNQYLQRAFDKYGEDNFEIIILQKFESITELELLQKEQFVLDIYQPYRRENGYNIANLATSNRGYKFTEDQKIKLSTSLKKFYVEHPEAKKEISKRMMGEKNHRYKKSISEYQRSQIILSNQKPCKPETKIKIANSLKGKKRSDEDKQKMSKPRSENGKKNIAIAMKKREQQIYQFDLEKNLVKIWESSKQIQEALSYLRTTISAYARKNSLYKNFYWSYNSTV